MHRGFTSGRVLGKPHARFPNKNTGSLPTVLTAKQLDKYADVLLWGLDTSRLTPYQPGDTVLIQCDLAGLKLTEALFSKLMGRGINVVPRLAFTSRMELDFYQKAAESQLSFIAPGTKELYENLHGAIYVLAPDCLTHLSCVDPKRIAQTAIARKPYRDILVKREEAGLFGWTLCVYPTEEYAKCAGLSKKEFADQVINACHLRAADPVKEWQRIFDEAGVKSDAPACKVITQVCLRAYNLVSASDDDDGAGGNLQLREVRRDVPGDGAAEHPGGGERDDTERGADCRDRPICCRVCICYLECVHSFFQIMAL
jgi:hypothetical protein